MTRYIASRLGWGAVVIFGVTLLTFLLLHAAPGDPARVLAGARADEETIARIRGHYKLDQPLWRQYGDFVARLARGDLGESIARGEPVARILASRAPATALLALTGWLTWVFIGFGWGFLTAIRSRGPSDTGLLVVSVLTLSTPSFWVGLLLLYLFAVRLKWFPAGGVVSPEGLVLPAATLALAGVGYYARLAQASTTEVLLQPYLQAARARGLPPLRLYGKHVLRNALLPLVTVAGADLATLLGGIVFTETVFAWPGLGRLAVESVAYLDVPVIAAIVTFSALFVVILNLAVDLLYPFLDPRIRSS